MDRIGEVSMKEKVKKNIIGFIIGVITAFSISVIAATYFPSNQTTYDNTNTELQSTNVQDAIDELYGVCFPPKTGSDTITDLVDTNSNELYKDDKGNIRYYGKNPNNYVSFNNELWRIIGVIDGKIKIIRNENIGEMVWDEHYNNWNKSDLKSYLNGVYYNSIDGTYRNMISEETYYLGGIPEYVVGIGYTASEIYEIERSNNVYSGNPASTQQYIGIMYPSDYGYAAGNSCLSTQLRNYDLMECIDNDWLFSQKYEWLLTPSAYNDYNVMRLGNDGIISPEISAGNANVIRPTLYLSQDIKITDGNGSQSNPYQLG